MTFFHGGPGFLKVGDLVLPPSKTGVASCAEYGAEKVCARDRVYLTTNPLAAEMFAAMCPHGGEAAVFEVEPVGAVEDDPDCNEPGLSFQCAEAKIVSVAKRMTMRDRALMFAAVMEAGT